MCLNAIVSRCVDSEGPRFEKLYLFNEKMVHLVDDIFWNLGFRSAEHAEKVTSEDFHYLISAIILLTILHISGSHSKQHP